MKFLTFRLAACVVLWTTRLAVLGLPRADHVFIVSIDGGKPSVIAQSEMPTLKRLVAEGAGTWTASTIFPSVTLPSHTSMLTGVGPDKHHVLWNTWKPRKGVVCVPTIFAEAKRAGWSTAMFVGKEKFRHLVQPGAVDEFEFRQVGPKKFSTVVSRVVAEGAARYILEHKPNLCFIHFSDPDDTGHKYGWGSPQQIEAFGGVDKALAEVVKSIQAAGISDRSVLIITADHGGHGRTHGRKIPEDMLIPWIVWGRNVKRDFQITEPVTTYDTAATALWLLDVPAPGSLDGQPVASAFNWQGNQFAPQVQGATHQEARLDAGPLDASLLKD
jgi:predicted AlkP superfamily pyrophosphatase or phosphodiesterase